MKTVLKVVKGTLKLAFYIAYACVILVLAKHSLNYFYNEYVLSHYEKGDYSINDNLLVTLNFIEPYVVYYNNANILYQNSLFEDAIKEYEAALSYDNVPTDCQVKARINIALSMIATLPEDYDSIDDIDDSIELLKDAKEIVSDSVCEGDETVNTLIKEIDESIEYLEAVKETYHECSDQTDAALAIIDSLPEDYDAVSNIEASIATYQEAQAVLLEKGCATENDQGHYGYAQELYNWINNEIERLNKILDEYNSHVCAAYVSAAYQTLNELADDYYALENIDESLDILQMAKLYLTYMECGKDDGTGHDEHAQTLLDWVNEQIYWLRYLQDIEEFGEHECQDQIDEALEIINSLPEDFTSDENKEESIETLLEARDILMEYGCAKDNDEGHDEYAQQLKDWIDRMIQSMSQDGGDGGEPEPVPDPPGVPKPKPEPGQEPEPMPENPENPGPEPDPDNPGGEPDPDNPGGGEPDPNNPGGGTDPGPGTLPTPPVIIEPGTPTPVPNGGDEDEGIDVEAMEDLIRAEIEESGRLAYIQSILDMQEYQEWNIDWWNWDSNYDGIW